MNKPESWNWEHYPENRNICLYYSIVIGMNRDILMRVQAIRMLASHCTETTNRLLFCHRLLFPRTIVLVFAYTFLYIQKKKKMNELFEMNHNKQSSFNKLHCCQLPSNIWKYEIAASEMNTPMFNVRALKYLRNIIANKQQHPCHLTTHIYRLSLVRLSISASSACCLPLCWSNYLDVHVMSHLHVINANKLQPLKVRLSAL